MSWHIKTNDFKIRQLNAKIIACNKNENIKQSFKKLMFYWGVAVLCILIPLLHFILVPAFLVTGVLSFFKQYRNTHHLLQAEYICPACDNHFNIKNIYFSERHKLHCDLCQAQLVIESK